ncbi:MAG: hypothetical protein S4CHLAM20_02430 [Chlamydiia bacterium]|nr:hypothetical protein [Chlamydiia bacterium]
MQYLLIPVFCLFGGVFYGKTAVKTEAVQEKHTLTLYVSKKCKYCKKVLRYAKENHISLVIKDVKKSKNKKVLMELAKKGQVPCLFIDGKPMHESDDIIEYLKDHK